MATTPPSRVTDLARSYRLDIDTGTYPTVSYTQLLGVEDAKLIIEPRTVSDEVYEDAGAMAEEVTGYSWRIELKLKNSKNAAGTSRDAVHAFLRSKHLALRSAAARQSEFGIRWYHRDGLVAEAHEGRVYVKSWTPDGGQNQDTISVVLFGQGAITDITNPAGSQVPAVLSIDPNTGDEAGGDVIVNIYGDHFTGATDVDFGANPATAFTVLSDSHIVAIPPAGSSTVQVKVTTAAGSSTDTDADNYTYTS